eukprot:SAG22_NODE_3020_length_2018_cov_3.003127_2_plen_227_part_00
MACGSSEDYYYLSPWRAPGSAPVFDSCGLAGGNWKSNPTCGYDTTPHAKIGDRGSRLPALAAAGNSSGGGGSTVWTAGKQAEVAWTIQANHGGGYQYRLCPAGSNLTEDCFQRQPLKFVGDSSLRWNGTGGPQKFFEAVEVTVQSPAVQYRRAGEQPRPSTWRRNPIPRCGARQAVRQSVSRRLLRATRQRQAAGCRSFVVCLRVTRKRPPTPPPTHPFGGLPPNW